MCRGGGGGGIGLIEIQNLGIICSCEQIASQSAHSPNLTESADVIHPFLTQHQQQQQKHGTVSKNYASSQIHTN